MFFIAIFSTEKVEKCRSTTEHKIDHLQNNFNHFDKKLLDFHP